MSCRIWRGRLDFTARFARDAEFAEKIYVFFSAERAEKKRSYSVMAVKIVAEHRTNTSLNKMIVSSQDLRLLFSVFLQVPPFLSGINGKQQKNQFGLCVLCDSAVNYVFALEGFDE